MQKINGISKQHIWLIVSAVVVTIAALVLYKLNLPYGEIIFLLYGCLLLALRVASRAVFWLTICFLAGVFLTLVTIGGQNKLSLSLASYAFILFAMGVLAAAIEQGKTVRSLK